MSSNNSKLDSMLSQLDLMVGKSRIWLKTFEEIGLKSKELRASGFDQAFGIFQIAVFNSLAIEVYNIFDDDPHYEMITIPKILKELKQECYTVENPERYKEFLRKLEVRLPQDNLALKTKSIEELNKRRPNFQNDTALKQIMLVRNNFVSHKNFDHVISEKIQKLPTSEEFERLFKWADTFRLIIYKGFLPNYIPADMPSWANWQTENVTALIEFVLSQKERALAEALEASISADISQ